MNNINLEAIFYKAYPAYKYTGSINKEEVIDAMRIIADALLVLATKEAKNAISTNPNSDLAIKKSVENAILSIKN